MTAMYTSAAGDLPAFVPSLNLSRSGVINVFASQSDGRILIGGRLDSINGVPRRKLAGVDATRLVDPI